jgi:probable O-glycosylation ligase (exosortase A-associated)
MPIRDVAVTLIIAALLPVCFARPWIGALTWAWLAYMNPHKLAWGFATTMPFALAVAIATLGGFLLTTERKPFLWTRETLLMLALWGWFGLTTVFAEYPAYAQQKLLEVSKILLMALLTVPLFQDRRRLRWLLLVITGSLGYYGVKGGLGSFLYGGQATVLGPPGSFISANNELGLALNMVLPIMVFLARDEPRRWLRTGLRVAAPLTVIAIAFTYSRGAILGLVIVLAALFLKGRQRLLLALMLAIGLVAFMSFAPTRWLARMETLHNYEADNSARARLGAWRVAYRIALEHPFTGAGFRVFWERSTYVKYGERAPRKGQDAHSLYFNLLGEHGWIGFGLFLALIGSTLAMLRRVRKQAASRPDQAWIVNYSHMLQISFLAYLTVGAFVSVAYFDLTYQLILIAVILGRFAEEPVGAVEQPLARPAVGAVRPRLPVWVR